MRANDDGVFICPIPQCLHCSFKSKRGCRRHIDTKHQWYFYFDAMPLLRDELIMEARKAAIPGVLSKKQPSFTVDDGIGKDFRVWLNTPCGGGKSAREATQSAKRAMKFVM